MWICYKHMDFVCPRCNKNFTRKLNLERHLNNKNPCEKLVDKTILLNNNVCSYCKKNFTRKHDLYRHIKNNCNMLKNKSDDVKDVYFELQSIKEKHELMKEKNESMEKEIIRLKQFEKENKRLKKEINNIDNNNNNSNNINGSNNSVIIGNNNRVTNNITIVAHGKEDFDRVFETDREIIFLLKKGWESPRYSICKTNFNRKFPEYNNIYLPDLKNKHTIVYNGNKYMLRDTDDVVIDLYDKHVEYIKDMLDEFGDDIPHSKHKALLEAITLLKDARSNPEKRKVADKLLEKIKLLLFNNKDIAIDTRKMRNMKTKS